MDRIVVGVDGSEGSQRALRFALEEARHRGARVDVVYAWHVPYMMATPYVTPDGWDPSQFEDDARRVLDRLVDAEDTTGIEVHRLLVADTTVAALVDAAQDAAMLVVGTRGRGGFKGLLLGSVSQQVVQHATCPVVVVPDRD